MTAYRDILLDLYNAYFDDRKVSKVTAEELFTAASLEAGSAVVELPFRGRLATVQVGARIHELLQSQASLLYGNEVQKAQDSGLLSPESNVQDVPHSTQADEPAAAASSAAPKLFPPQDYQSVLTEAAEAWGQLSVKPPALPQGLYKTDTG